MGKRIAQLISGALLLTVLASGQAHTADLTTLVKFNYSNGQSPYVGNLLADGNGNLFGTTLSGGISSTCIGCGTAFEILKTASGYSNSPVVLMNSNGTNVLPYAGLIADANGSLFGTTALGPLVHPT